MLGGLLRSFTFMLVVAVSSSCSSNELEPAISNCQSLDNVDQGKVIVDDNLVMFFLKGPLNWENIKIFLSNIDKQEVTSTHSPAESNYIARANFKSSHFSYYLSSTKSFPLCVYTDDERIIGEVLNKDLFSGLKANTKKHSIFVSNLEGGNLFRFTFLNNKLQSIAYRATYVD